jgi:hypothetical protein
MRVPLTGGAYQARSIAAAAQRAVNLYAEPIPQAQGEPAQMAHFPTPGLRLVGALPQGPVRAIRQATTGGIYAVGGSGVYSLDTAFNATSLGTITAGVSTPASLSDNGLDLVIVDGTSGGWHVTLSNNAFAAIDDPNGMFAGADRVDYLDTYFIFNKPGTPQFYISGSLALTFDALDFANKQSFSDLLTTLAVAKRELWLLGNRTTEVWYDQGATDIGAGSFPFAEVQSVFVDHGCAAKYSVATYDNAVFWLTADRQGQGIVMQGAGYQTKRVSTYAIEAEIAGYATISDAIGFTYQIAGHTFYVLTFPTADKTWSYDVNLGEWHEWLWIDANGEEHRHRANCCYPINGEVIVGDWQNGNLYAVDLTAFTDNGQPIKRLRSYPHLLADGKRVFYRQFQADMETGNSPAAVSLPPSTPILTSFTAADNTPFASYSHTGDAGGPWTGSGGIILNDAFTGAGSGTASYEATGVPNVADYVVRFSVIPPSYGSVTTGNSLWAMGRATDASHGYRCTVSADGTQYHVALDVEGTAEATRTVAMGTIPSGSYAVAMALRGSSISVQVQRTSDSLWLTGAGSWIADATAQAISAVDLTYTAAGRIFIGGAWP